MTVRSGRLAGPITVPAGATVVLFTVPGGQTWLVKQLQAVNTGALGGVWYFDVLLGGVSCAFYSPTIAALRADDHPTWMALDPGCQLRVSAPAAGGGFAMAYGAKLAGVAP